MRLIRKSPLAYALLGYVTASAVSLTLIVRASPDQGGHHGTWQSEPKGLSMAPHDAISLSEGALRRLALR